MSLKLVDLWRPFESSGQLSERRQGPSHVAQVETILHRAAGAVYTDIVVSIASVQAVGPDGSFI